MKKNVIVIITVLFVIQYTSAQSPWSREVKKTYVQLGYTSLTYDLANFDGENVENFGTISDNTFQIYSEYGITNKLEAQLILPFKYVSQENELQTNRETISGLSNVTIGLKYKFIDSKIKISSGLLFIANSIKIDTEKNLSTGINSSTILPYVSVGSSHNKWYYFGNIGYAYMNNDYSDYLKIGVEIGYNIIPNGHIMIVLDSKNVLRKENAFLTDTNQWLSHLDRQAYQAIGLKTNYEFIKDSFGANFSFFGATGIENSPLAPTLNFGVYTKF